MLHLTLRTSTLNSETTKHRPCTVKSKVYQRHLQMPSSPQHPLHPASSNSPTKRIHKRSGLHNLHKTQAWPLLYYWLPYRTI